MFKKENLPPVKQGVFYQLNLNKNNGPFLSKDIMYDNPKSFNLLANQAAILEHKKMSQTMTVLEKTLKMNTISEYST
jgi:hypothetical protein